MSVVVKRMTSLPKRFLSLGWSSWKDTKGWDPGPHLYTFCGFSGRGGPWSPRPTTQDSKDGANTCSVSGAGGVQSSSPKEQETTSWHTEKESGVWLIHLPFLHLLATHQICFGELCSPLPHLHAILVNGTPKMSPSDPLPLESEYWAQEYWEPLISLLFYWESPRDCSSLASQG